MFEPLQLFLVIIMLHLVLSDELEIIKESGDEQNQNSRFLVRGGYRPKNHTLFKYIVSIRFGNKIRSEGDNHICGGSIIFRDVVLTAAHCLYESDNYDYDDEEKVLKGIKKFKVIAGTPYLDRNLASQRNYTVVKMIPHPDFESDTFKNDVALYLDHDVDENEDTISFVPLMDREPKPGMECITFGWGRIFPYGPRPTELLYINLTILEPSICLKEGSMPSGVFCAGQEDDMEKGTDQGDSGGPFLCNGKLTGITSYGYSSIDSPDYYADVYYFRNWIINNAERINLCNHFIIFFMLNFYITIV